jgi:hypothetical protein
MNHKLGRWLGCGLVLFLMVETCLDASNQASALAAVNGDGIMTYGETAITAPRWRTYAAANTFAAEAATVTGAIPSTITAKTSPTKQEAIVGYVNASGVLQVMCYNGTTWTNEWSVTVGGGTGTANRFDIAYETASGDVMVAYSTNVATTNEMAYRTKLGSSGCGTANWAAATNIDPVRTSGTVLWIRLEGSPVAGSNTIGLAWSDSAFDLSAQEWTGASWAVAEPAAVLDANIERVTAAGDVQTFDVAFESLTGNFMVVWGPSDAAAACTVGSNCIKYARYTTSWSAATAIPTVGDEATNIDIAANPTSNEIVVGAIGNRASTLSTAYWSGSAWTGTLDTDATSTTPIAGTKLVAVSWLKSGATTRSIVSYADATATATSLSYYTGNAGVFTVGTDFVGAPVPGAFRWLDSAQDPLNPDRLMLAYSDANSDLFAKRLIMTSTPAFTWTNADASAALEATLVRATYQPFNFAYWRFIPPTGTLTADIVDGAGSTVASPSLSMTGVAAGNSCQVTTGALGASVQKIRVTNTTVTPGWTLSMAPTLGATTSWSSGTANYDFNDASGSPAGCGDGGDADTLAGQLSVNPSVGTLTPQAGCSNTGVTLGSSSAYAQGVTDSITLMNASALAQTSCYWELTTIDLSQRIPSFQAPGAYAVNMTITVVAN